MHTGAHRDGLYICIIVCVYAGSHEMCVSAITSSVLIHTQLDSDNKLLSREKLYNSLTTTIFRIRVFVLSFFPFGLAFICVHDFFYFFFILPLFMLEYCIFCANDSQYHVCESGRKIASSIQLYCLANRAEKKQLFSEFIE